MKNCRVGLYEKSMPSAIGLREKLSIAKKYGYDYLELSIDETDEKLSRLDWTDEEIEQIRGWQAETGMPIHSICLSGHRKYPLGAQEPEVQQRSMEIMRKAIVLACEIGARLIQIAGYDVYYSESSPETRSAFAENLKKSVEFAASHGVILAFETMETEFMNTVGKAMEWVEKINSPYLQIYPDLGNITNAALSYGVSAGDDLVRGKGHIAALHLKESKPGIFREVPYGEGHVDFAGLVKTALDLGVRMFVTEFWYTGNEDWERVIEDNRRYFSYL